MTELMERLIDRLKSIPEEEQDPYAAAYLEELNDDQRWDKLFAETTDEQWEKMTSDARKEAEENESIPLEEFLNSTRS
ncbi:MAG: hypothetical protein BRD30_02025 [Bacteroidetes bacterium QH_2_63_10]|nr:MAG: hypothetical protein BRD30_02025 [Bacteroidetes bacterium QH_2_63_10]